MKSFLFSLFTFLFAVSSFAEVGSNWYLDYFTGETEMYAKYLNKDGVVIEEASGIIVQSVNDEGEIQMKSALIFKKSGDKAKSKSILKTTDQKDVYAGSAEDAKGNKFAIQVEVIGDNKYKTVVTGEEGYSVAIIGELKDDGKVHATEKIYRNEEVTSTSEVIFSKKDGKEAVLPETKEDAVPE